VRHDIGRNTKVKVEERDQLVLKDVERLEREPSDLGPHPVGPGNIRRHLLRNPTHKNLEKKNLEKKNGNRRITNSEHAKNKNVTSGKVPYMRAVAVTRCTFCESIQ
jgi:hypothetical protein